MAKRDKNKKTQTENAETEGTEMEGTETKGAEKNTESDVKNTTERESSLEGEKVKCVALLVIVLTKRRQYVFLSLICLRGQ